jgi:hypothetical protein
MPTIGRLVEASMALRAEAPRGWEEFQRAMSEYAAQVTAEMLRAPPELLNRAQGMAIQATEIATTLREAPQTYEKMQIARLGQKHGQRS